MELAYGEISREAEWLSIALFTTKVDGCNGPPLRLGTQYFEQCRPWPNLHHFDAVKLTE
jgi:hypothetical protein